MKLELELYFKTYDEIGKTIWDVHSKMKQGVFSLDTYKLKYHVLLTEERPYREEIINGACCMIFESRMNYE